MHNNTLLCVVCRGAEFCMCDDKRYIRHNRSEINILILYFINIIPTAGIILDYIEQEFYEYAMLAWHHKTHIYTYIYT